MQRRTFLLQVGAVAGCCPLVAHAQQKKIPVIGCLGLIKPDPEDKYQAAFRQGLRETGYIEGESVRTEYRWAEEKPERYPALAAELVRLNVDVIITFGGTAAALAAKRATTTIPIVFTGVGDPIAQGLVTNLSRPDGNVTGLSVQAPELIGKWLELLKEAAPGISLIAFLIKPDSLPKPAIDASVKEAKVAAQTLGVKLQVFEARGPEDFDQIFLEMSKAQAGGLVVLTTPVFNKEHQRLADLATKYKFPMVCTWQIYADAGGLMSYGPDYDDLAKRTAATYVSKILRGIKPTDLPIEQPTKFRLVINMRAAKALGLTVPQSLLARAEEIIE
jgi:ABC-type uncharacterized transport system substrate-binding protein